MRIISGKHKGRRINAPKKLPVRPTTDMAKEGLFNILNNSYRFRTLTVLDLFAGTGNISYEFASRGAANITAVDADTGCVSFIDRTAREFEFPITAYKSDAFKYLERASQPCDIIFADPPYDIRHLDFLKIADSVFEKNLLNKDGVLVIEHSKTTSLEEHPRFQHARKYGGSVFSFFE